MENELEMIQTLSEYQNFGLVPFPCSPFSTKIHDSVEGRLLFHKASQGIQMNEKEIIEDSPETERLKLDFQLARAVEIIKSIDIYKESLN